MKKSEVSALSPSVSRRQLLLLPLALWGSRLFAQDTTPVPVPSNACPLNSGGPSLLGSRWRLYSIYGNRVPTELEITMKVEQTAMTGLGGCNDYTASFKQVGNRGFKVTNIQQTRQPCEVLRPAPGAPTINVGNWEGNYLRVLRRAGSVQQLGTTLQFFDFNGAPSIIFAKRYGTGLPPAPEAGAATS
ncbi:MAG: META domain-containing protein [Thiolinea sp.]